MAPPISKRWTTHPEYIELRNYVIERTKDAKSPINIQSLAKEFKEKRGAAQTVSCLMYRIIKMRTLICSFEHIDTNTKVTLIFALSASIDRNFLKDLKKDALVEVDDEKRISHYKANDGSLELSGDHSLSAKCRTAQLESKGSLRSMIINYFETKDDADTVPKSEELKEMGNFIEFITEKCVNVDTPLSIIQLAKDFKNRFGISVPLKTICTRVESYGREIQKVELLDTQTKVQQLFGLSATVDSDCLKEFRKDATVEIDEKNRITYYKANDGSLVLRGDHSLSAKTKTGKLESKGSLRSLINSYFETKDNANALPKNKEEKEMGNLIELITEKCGSVDSPLSIRHLVKDFKIRFGISVPSTTICTRVKRYSCEIQKVEFLNTRTKVQQLFSLSATVDSDYLKRLRKNALVEVDDKKRITFYKANDGSFELRGDHNRSAKSKNGFFESKRSIRSLIIDYLENKNNNDAVAKNEAKKEMGNQMKNLIEFINEKCQTVDSPLNIRQLAEDFENRFGTSSIPITSFRKRIRRYCREIQKTAFSDTHSRVRQLFGLSATLDSNFLKELRKDAVVEVDDLNRITKYTSNNGRLTLHGEHSRSAKVKLVWIERRKKRNAVEKHSISDEIEESENENEYSEDDSDEYSSEEFDSEFDSEDENDSLDQPDHMDSSNEANDFDNETPIRNRSPTEISIDDNLDFGPPTERSHRSGEIEMGEDQENDTRIMGNAVIKTRSGRLSKRRYLDSEFSYNLASSRSSAAPASFESEPSKPAKQKKIESEKEHAPSLSNQSRSSSRSIRRFIGSSPAPSFSTESGESMENQNAPRAEVNPSDYQRPRIQGIKDYDYNPREDNTSESLSIDNRLGEPEPSAAEDHNTKIEAQNDHNTVTIGDSFNFDLPTEKTPRPEETGMRGDEKNDPVIGENLSFKTRSGRLSKRRHSDSEFTYYLANRASSRATMNINSASVKPAKQKKIASEQEQASSKSKRRSSKDSSFPAFSTKSGENMGNQDAAEADGNPNDYHPPRIQEMDDYDYNPREDNIPESSLINIRPQESEPPAAEENNSNIDTEDRSDSVAPEPNSEKECHTLQNNKNTTTQTNGEKVILPEVPIKVEQEEPVENPTEDVKPEIAHNFKIKFFGAMKSLILFLDTPSLSDLKTKIYQKIRKVKRSNEVLQNNELIPALELLIARMTNHSVMNISESVESVSLIQLFCYLKASILNSKMIGVEGLMNNISGLIEKSQNKRIPMEKVANALRATLDVDNF